MIPAPLYRDPIWDGAADPMVIRKEENGKYHMFYTQRRAMQQVEGVSYCYGSAGTEVKFIAADRTVLKTSYCTRKVKKLFREKYETTRDVDRLTVPEDVHTVEELRNYVRRHRPLWI